MTIFKLPTVHEHDVQRPTRHKENKKN